MASQGWYRRGTPTTATGTTSLSINKPTGTIDDDIMVMILCHKGAGYATLPAGWTSVIQQISGSTRGEIAWRRASGEGASYSVTGLADTAIGAIISYVGGLLTGDVVDAFNSRANASGADGTLGFTPSEANLLLLNAAAVGDDLSTLGASSFNTDDSNGDSVTGMASFKNRNEVSVTTTNGTDCALRVSSIVAHQTVPITSAGWTGSVATENVGMIIGLKMEPVSLTQTQFYTDGPYANPILTGKYNGEWTSDLAGPTDINEVDFPVLHLVPSKLNTSSFASQRHTITVNQLNQASVHRRAILGPIDGTTNLDGLTATILEMVDAVKTFDLGVGTLTVRFKVHAYLTDGYSLDVKQVLVDNEIDSGGTAFTTTQTFRAFTVAFPGTVNNADGDCIVFEIGSYVEAIPTPVPTRPPIAWAEISWAGGNCIADQQSGFTMTSGYGAADGVALSTTAAAQFITFSGPVTLKASTATNPTNYTCASPTVIPVTLPYKITDFDVSASQGSNRAVWYSWTPDHDQKVSLIVNGSGYFPSASVYDTGTCGSFIGSNEVDYLEQRFDSARVRAAGGATWNAISGTTYFIKIEQSSAAAFASNDGGALWLELFEWPEFTDGDIFCPAAGVVTVWREDQLVGILYDFLTSGAPSGIAIDYTGNPMTDQVTGLIVTDHRILVAIFDADFIQIIDLQTLNVGRNSIDFIFDPLSEVTNILCIDVDAQGVLYVAGSGNGYTYVAGDFSSFEFAVADADTAKVNVIPATHGDNQPSAPWPPATLKTLALEAGGTDYIELPPAPANHTLKYSSAGEYLPLGGVLVKSYDTDTDTQGTDITTTTPSGPVPGPKGICILPNNTGFLVCNGSDVQRYSNAGVLQTVYNIPESSYLADVDLAPDGLHFWVLDGGKTLLHKVRISDGAILITNQVLPGSWSSTTSFVVYRTNRFSTANAGSGIYKIVPGKREDTLWDAEFTGTADVKIPEPFAKLGYLG